MALDDRDIFNAICARFSDQPIEYIMEQYEKAKRLNMDIEKRAGLTALTEMEQAAAEAAPQGGETEEQPAPVQKKRYTKRMLKVKPQDSITEDAIYCCICGEKRQSLTVKHLAAHDITVADYKKLCDFPPNQPLMSHRKLNKSKEIIRRAQQVRLDKRKALAED